jgi:hypothetical protein
LHFYVVQVPGKHQIPFKQKETYLKTKEFQWFSLSNLKPQIHFIG